MGDAEKGSAEALAAVKAEATARKLEDGSVVVPLVTERGSVDITVPPPLMWFDGAVEALERERITSWIRLAVEDPEMLARWDSLRKRYRDLADFVNRWAAATGESPGESQGSSGS